MGYVPIIMGSRADLSVAQEVAAELERLGVRSEMRVASAHKAARYLLEMLTAYEADPEKKVYVTIAGRSNALSGLVDASVTAPVIACPPYSERFAGWDVLSSLRMPSGVAPAVVLEPATAALLAAKILGVADHDLASRVAQRQRAASTQIIADDHSMSDEGSELEGN